MKELAAESQVWGTGGPEFKSRRSDQRNQRVIRYLRAQIFPRNRIGRIMGSGGMRRDSGRFGRPGRWVDGQKKANNQNMARDSDKFGKQIYLLPSARISSHCKR